MSRRDSNTNPQEAIGQRFEKIASADPFAIAIEGSGYQWSYGDVSERAHKVAASLIANADKNAVVGVVAAHGPEAIVGILGAAIAGWTYTPLDPNAPLDSLRHMMSMSKLSVLLTDAENMKRAGELAGAGVLVLSIDDIIKARNSSPITSVSLEHDPLDSAYILYTSGSEGPIKAVCHNLASLQRSVDCYTNDSALTETDRVSLVTPLGFTPSIFTLFGALLNGATLCPFDLARGTAQDATNWLEQVDLSLLYTTPTLFRRWASGLADIRVHHPHEPRRLRMIQLAGEPLLASDVALFQRKFPTSVVLYNGMGTTETSCVARYFIDHTMSFSDGCVPIGYAYDDLVFAIRNEDGRMLGAGEIGELHIGGDYFPGGYLNAQSQASDIHRAEEAGSRSALSYHTGDLAMRDEGGRLLHCGRVGNRIRIDGVGVDLHEIDSLLMNMEGVCEAAVVAAGPVPTRSLVAFVSLVDDANIKPEDLRRALAMCLPAAMVPAQCVILNELPVLAAGKVDRLALRELVPDLVGLSAMPSRPLDKVDQAVLASFRDILGKESLSGSSDFFAEGGDAYQALELTMQIERELGIGLSVSRLAQAPTPTNLAHELRRQIARRTSELSHRGDRTAGATDQEAVWQIDHAPLLDTKPVEARDLSEPDLLDHTSSMTETLARRCGQDIALRVLAQRQAGRYFMRKIKLVCAPDQTLAIATIRIDLQAFAPELRQTIMAGRVPFGTLMAEHRIDLVHKPQGFFSVKADDYLRAQMQLASSAETLFGRINLIEDRTGGRLADVVEVLSDRA